MRPLIFLDPVAAPLSIRSLVGYTTDHLLESLHVAVQHFWNEFRNAIFVHSPNLPRRYV